MVIRNESQDRRECWCCRMFCRSHQRQGSISACSIPWRPLASGSTSHSRLRRHEQEQALRDRLRTLCDEVVLLPSAFRRTRASQLFHQAAGSLYAAGTGLKRSNYALGRVEFHPARIETLLGTQRFDCVLYEYLACGGQHPGFSTPRHSMRARHARCVVEELRGKPEAGAPRLQARGSAGP